MINRLDNICEAVVKGKWPANRRQLFDFPGLLPGYVPSTASDSPLQRRSFAELSMVGQASYSGSEDVTLSPQMAKASWGLADDMGCMLVCREASWLELVPHKWLCRQPILIVKHQ